VLEIEIIAKAWGDQEELLDTEISRVNDNQFIMTSDSAGLADKEQLFGIIPSPGESLSFRRKRLMDRTARRPPYTWYWLQERLDDLLEGEYVISRNLAERSLTIYILLTKQEHLEFIASYVLEIIPANMIVNVILRYNTYGILGEVTTHRALGQYKHATIPVQPL